MKKIIQSILIAAFLFAAFGVHSQPYPSKPIRLIVPFAPGGVTDVSGRIVAIALAKRLNQQVIVENKPGASGNIGAQLVSKAAPDGYTLLLALDGTLVINPHVYERTGFDALNDFAPIAKVGDSIIIIVAHPSVGVKTLAEMIALSKTNGKGLEFGTSGTGSITQVAGELLKQRSGANLLHVPYNNNRQVTDVLAGDVPLTISIVSSVTPYTRAGRLRALAVAGAKRLEILPDVPTVSEVLPAFEPPPTWTALFAPPGLSKQLLARLHAAVAKTTSNPELRAKASADGFELIGNTPEEFSAQLKRDIEVAGRLVKAAKIEPTD